MTHTVNEPTPFDLEARPVSPAVEAAREWLALVARDAAHREALAQHDADMLAAEVPF